MPCLSCRGLTNSIMKQISENSTHITYLDYFQGKQVRISKSKSTGELLFNSEDVAKVLGYKDHNDMMADPKVQAKALGVPDQQRETNVYRNWGN